MQGIVGFGKKMSFSHKVHSNQKYVCIFIKEVKSNPQTWNKSYFSAVKLLEYFASLEKKPMN